MRKWIGWAFVGVVFQAAGLCGNVYSLEEISSDLAPYVVKQDVYRGFLYNTRNQAVRNDLHKLKYEKVTPDELLKIYSGIGQYLFATLQVELSFLLQRDIADILKKDYPKDVLEIFSTIPDYLENPLEISYGKRLLAGEFLDRVEKKFKARRDQLKDALLLVGKQELERSIYAGFIYDVMEERPGSGMGRDGIVQTDE